MQPMAKKKMVVKIPGMNDEKIKQKAMSAAADVDGIDYLAADINQKILTIIGQIDGSALVKKLKKFGAIDIVSVGPYVKEEKKSKPKEEPKPEPKKEEPKKEEPKKPMPKDEPKEEPKKEGPKNDETKKQQSKEKK